MGQAVRGALRLVSTASTSVRGPCWADGSSGQLLKRDGTIHLPRGWRACGEPRSAPGPVPRTTPLSPRCPGGHSWLWNAAPGPEGTGRGVAAAAGLGGSPRGAPARGRACEGAAGAGGRTEASPGPARSQVCLFPRK